MSKRFSGKFPDGTPTTSAADYFDAWYKLSKPMEKQLGLRLLGFDPGFSFVAEGRPAPVEIPVWLAQRIVKAINGAAK